MEKQEESKDITLLERVLGILKTTILILFYITYLPLLSILCIFSELILYKTKYREKLVYAIKIIWIEVTLAFFGFYVKRSLVVAYDKRLVGISRSFIISNHLTNYDWIFVLRILYFLGKYEDLCIVLKESLEKIPFFGYGMKVFGFIFLKRNLENDRHVLQESLLKLKPKDSFSLLFFPEGTILDRNSHPKSRSFAEKERIKLNNRSIDFEQVLVPKTSGYKIVNEVLFDNIQGVLDMTLFFNPYRKYPQDTFSYVDIFFGGKADINFLFIISFIEKQGSENTERFLYSLFYEKNANIQKYANLSNYRKVTRLLDFKSFFSNQGFPEDIYTFTEVNMWTKHSKWLVGTAFLVWTFSALLVLRALFG